MTQLARSRHSRFHWRTGRSIRAVHLFLRNLEVPYREGEDFWRDNQHQLRELYEAMQDAARERMMEMHPDRGGDGREFAQFITDYRSAQKSFSRHLVSAPPASSSTVKFTPIEQVRRDRKAAQARERRRKNKKAFRAYRREYYYRRKAAGFRDPKSLERTRLWRKRHPIKWKRSNKRWREAHPEKVREWKRASYHRHKAAGTLPKRKKRPEKKARLSGRRDRNGGSHIRSEDAGTSTRSDGRPIGGNGRLL
jgi:hypothetical protein